MKKFFPYAREYFPTVGVDISGGQLARPRARGRPPPSAGQHNVRAPMRRFEMNSISPPLKVLVFLCSRLRSSSILELHDPTLDCWSETLPDRSCDRERTKRSRS